MSYMLPQVIKMDVFSVDTDLGTEIVPADLVGTNPSPADLSQYVSGESIEDFDLKKEAVCGRLSAPGYMDRTAWTIYRNAVDAFSDLIDNYPESFKFQVFYRDNEALYDASCKEDSQAMLKAVPDIHGEEARVIGNMEGLRYQFESSGVTPDDIVNYLVDMGFEVEMVP